MRLATWNVNSIRTRAPRVLELLERHQIDVLAMQEIKCRNDQFPLQPFEDAGYQVFCYGVNQWNGVAVAVRRGLDANLLGTQFSGKHPHPRFGSGKLEPYLEPRALGVRVSGIEVWSLYIPNGRALGDARMAYKLDWLAALRSHVEATLQADPAALGLYLGDFNVAPRDEDVWDMADFQDATHVSVPERQAFAALLDADTWDEAVTLGANAVVSPVEDEASVRGEDAVSVRGEDGAAVRVEDAVTGGRLREVSRAFAPGWTYWDYQKARWRRNQGMKIDFALATPSLAPALKGAFVDLEERGGEATSDHAPLILDF